MALLSGLVGALGRFSVPFNGWLLAGPGPVGLSGFCATFVPGFPGVGGLQVAADGCFGGFGAGPRWDGERSSP